jgi:hypothetical protein
MMKCSWQSGETKGDRIELKDERRNKKKRKLKKRKSYELYQNLGCSVVLC